MDHALEVYSRSRLNRATIRYMVCAGPKAKLTHVVRSEELDRYRQRRTLVKPMTTQVSDLRSILAHVRRFQEP